jgi:hypothetical protein
MSAARQLPTPTTEPDPPRAGTDTPTPIGRVLSLVRKLIDYGKQLAATVQQHAAAPGFAYVARPFGTADLAVILARITCGLRRAAALEARLSQRAARGQDLPLAPIRLPTIRVAGAARQVAPPDVQPADPAQDPRLARLPTEEEIAAQVRRRPVGAVIADICRDLGIMPTHPLWGDLSPVILRYGGNLAKLWREILAQLRPRPTADRPPTLPAPSLPSLAPASTGPP